MYPLISIGNFTIKTFSIIIIIDIFICFGILQYKYRFDISKCRVIQRLVLQAVVGALVGGRLLSAITLSIRNNKNIFYYMLHGGNVFFGGFIGGMLSLYILCKRNNIRFLYISDNVLNILPFGQAIGRIGCYFNGCCYGKYNKGILAIDYVVKGVKTKVYPTWFIEMAGCLIIFIILQKATYKEGKSTFLYLLLYPTLRFLVEFLRGDEIRGIYAGISTSQILSVLIILLALIMKRRKIL